MNVSESFTEILSKYPVGSQERLDAINAWRRAQDESARNARQEREREQRERLDKWARQRQEQERAEQQREASRQSPNDLAAARARIITLEAEVLLLKTELEMEKLLRNTGGRSPKIGDLRQVDVAIKAQIKEDFSARRLVGMELDRVREFCARLAHKLA